MAHLIGQTTTSQYALYNGDSCEVLKDLPAASWGIAVYSPPFADLYRYSSSDRDLGNCRTYAEFLEHYRFIVAETFRLLSPGRMACVHCMDLGGAGKKPLKDFPGDIIRLHEELGFEYWDRKTIWKEPWRVALRTRALCLRHGQVTKDATWTRSALPDYLLVFRKPGESEPPVDHPIGFTEYPGTLPIFPPVPGWEDEWRARRENYENFSGDQRENKLSHTIWRRLASPLWDDVRVERVLPFQASKDEEAEKHVSPLQLDVIERALMLWSVEGDVLGSPFGGVGSEPFCAVRMGRRAVACELKPSYYQQMVRNVEDGAKGWRDQDDQGMLPGM